MRALLIAIIMILLSAGSTLAQDDRANDRRPISVNVVLTADYPAFTSPPAGATVALPLRAIILFESSVDGPVAVVLLNPAHANEHTLYEAFARIRGIVDGSGRKPSYIPVLLTPAVQSPSGSVAHRLSSILARLKDPESPRARLHHASGSLASTPDIRVFFPGRP